MNGCAETLDVAIRTDPPVRRGQPPERPPLRVPAPMPGRRPGYRSSVTGPAFRPYRPSPTRFQCRQAGHQTPTDRSQLRYRARSAARSGRGDGRLLPRSAVAPPGRVPTCHAYDPASVHRMTSGRRYQPSTTPSAASGCTTLTTSEVVPGRGVRLVWSPRGGLTDQRVAGRRHCNGQWAPDVPGLLVLVPAPKPSAPFSRTGALQPLHSAPSCFYVGRCSNTGPRQTTSARSTSPFAYAHRPGRTPFPLSLDICIHRRV